MDGNSHAHGMERDSMDEWTRDEDMAADWRCPDRCMNVGCTKVATEAFQLFFFITWLEDEAGNRVRSLKSTPWQYSCKGCAEKMSFEEMDEQHQELSGILRTKLGGV